VLTEERKMKLTDFSVAQKIEGKGKRNLKITGTPYYLAPELLKTWQRMESYCVYDPFESDIYSIGLTVVKLMEIIGHKDLRPNLEVDLAKIENIYPETVKLLRQIFEKKDSNS